MIGLLAKKWIRNREDIGNPDVRAAYGDWFATRRRPAASRPPRFFLESTATRRTTLTTAPVELVLFVRTMPM